MTPFKLGLHIFRMICIIAAFCALFYIGHKIVAFKHSIPGVNQIQGNGTISNPYFTINEQDVHDKIRFKEATNFNMNTFNILGAYPGETYSQFIQTESKYHFINFTQDQTIPLRFDSNDNFGVQFKDLHGTRQIESDDPINHVDYEGVKMPKTTSAVVNTYGNQYTAFKVQDALTPGLVMMLYSYHNNGIDYVLYFKVVGNEVQQMGFGIGPVTKDTLDPIWDPIAASK